jgi:MFS family permease
MPEPAPPAPPPAAPATLWSTGYAYFLVNLAAATLAIQLQNTVVGYQIYELTKDPFALGLVGLAEAIPFLCLVLFGGHIADRLDRRRVLWVSFSVMIAAALALFVLSRQMERLDTNLLKVAVYTLIAITGVCRSFIQPSRAALGAQLAPKHLAAKAVALRTGLFQLCAVLGPALGGLMLGLSGADGGYAATAILLAIACVSLAGLRIPARIALTHRPPLWTSLGEGITYLRRDDILRGAILLDLFAVLFGGAVALLPVFANDILRVGPSGFGLLRAAPAAGALIASVLLATMPPMRRAGLALYVSVTGFGACMVGFALSRWFWLSLLLLAASGAFDMVSVLIRSTLMQVRVPDEMMGRVSSINQIFVGSSNEIGAFESGLAAKLLGVVPSVVLGGLATLSVVAVSVVRSPKLRSLRSLT